MLESQTHSCLVLVLHAVVLEPVLDSVILLSFILRRLWPVIAWWIGSITWISTVAWWWVSSVACSTWIPKAWVAISQVARVRRIAAVVRRSSVWSVFLVHFVRFNHDPGVLWPNQVIVDLQLILHFLILEVLLKLVLESVHFLLDLLSNFSVDDLLDAITNIERKVIKVLDIISIWLSLASSFFLQLRKWLREINLPHLGLLMHIAADVDFVASGSLRAESVGST